MDIIKLHIPNHTTAKLLCSHYVAAVTSQWLSVINLSLIDDHPTIQPSHVSVGSLIFFVWGGGNQGHCESCSNGKGLTTNEVFLKQTTHDVTHRSTTSADEQSCKVIYSSFILPLICIVTITLTMQY